MRSRKLFFSRRFFLLNLVMTGGIVGFLLSVLLFSCASGVEPAGRVEARDDTGESVTPQQLQSNFRQVAAATIPSVVQIEVTEDARVDINGETPWYDFFFGDPEEDAPDRQPPGIGSGVVVRRNGEIHYVLTNDHVLGNSSEITVTLDDLTEYEAEVVGTDSRRDIALVQFRTPNDVPIARLGDSSELQVGDWVLAVGSPFGFQSTVTAGIVSALGRMGGPAGNISDFIQTDAAINRGNSGGPLVNLSGEVVGINTWITTQTGGSVGLGFSIPINNAKRAIDQFIETGEVEYGWLGVSIPETPRAVLEELGAPLNRGAMVHNVFTDSPAWKYGIRPGDFILEVNGGTVRNPQELTLFVGDLIVGEDATFTVLREGKRVELTVTIGRRDEEEIVTSAQAKLWPGLRIDVAGEEARSSFNLPRDTGGMLIQAVESRTPAAQAGLRRGDLIVSVNGIEIGTAKDFYQVLGDARGEELDIVYFRADDRRETQIEG